MKEDSFLRESLKIAVNRTATQISSILVVACLGLYSTNLLAAFSLALAAVAVFFIAITTVQFGVQAELSKQFARGDVESMYGVFYSTLWFVLSASLVGIVVAYVLPDPFGAVQQSEVRVDAGRAYRRLLLSLPLVATYTAIQFLLESMRRASLTFQIKLVHVALQILIVAWILYGKSSPATAEDLATGYVVADALGLVISSMAAMFVVGRRPFWMAARASLRPWLQLPHYVRAIRLGLPVSAGAVAQKYLFYYMGIHCAVLGASAASAFSVLTAIVFLLQIPVIGISHLATIRLAHATGTKSRSLLSSTWVEVRNNFLATALVVGAIGWAALPWLLKPFTKDPEVAAYVVGLTYLFPLYLLLNYLFGLLLGLLRGLSDSLYPQAVVNLVLFATVVPVLMFRPDMASFYGVVGIFCIAGCVAVAIIAKRWRGRYHDVYATQCV
ncbi:MULTISPECIES: MATE family efflux transporter [Cupriavidus]